ncbi:MAG TPA: protein-glutamate O-methyltransferase CheR [Candidatus Kapabacteria bacterium]|nr:protein-glutamate O-methyltransferase CheR [Candidatus Kapabacteria bacterium]
MENNILSEIRNLIYKNSGIYFSDNRLNFLDTRIQKRLTALEIDSLEKYYDILIKDTNRIEWKELFDVITINESYFFRSAEQLDVLHKYILPEIIQNKKGVDKTVRIWSAGCSTGEEPYSIAITIDEYLKSYYSQIQFQILATDINKTVLKKAREGIYNSYAVKNMPTHLLLKNFTISDTGYRLNDNIKQMVKFASINLFDAKEVKSVKGTDVIFCENVLIYFDIPSKKQVISMLYDVLTLNGYLFLGYSESLHSISDEFSLIHFPRVIVYKKM